MAADDHKTYTIALVVAGLFGWLILMFVGSMGAFYGVNTQDVGDGSLDSSNWESTLESLEDSLVEIGNDFVNVDVVDIGSTSGIKSREDSVTEVTKNPITLATRVAHNTLGVPPLFTGVLVGLFAVLTGFAIWRFLRAGD